MISHKYRFAYFSLPKVACSSLKHLVYKLENGHDFDPKKVQPRNPNLKNIHQIHPSRTFKQVDWKAMEGYWRFTVVRDPIERIISAYSDKVLRFRTLVNVPPSKNAPAEVHALYESLNKEPDLNTFCCNIEAYRKVSKKVDRHVCPISCYLGPDLGIYDKVYRFDALDQLVADLSERTGEDVTLPHRNQSKRGLGPGDLSSEAFDAISAFTAAEYAMLDGIYERPEAPVA